MQKAFISKDWFSFENCIVVKEHAVIDIKEKFRYVDGKKTDIVEAYKYSLVNLGTYESFDVTVLNEEPIITKEELDILKSKGQALIVKLKNPKIRGYYNSFTNSIADNIVVEDIIVVNKN